jgi:hypothetical protein
VGRIRAGARHPSQQVTHAAAVAAVVAAVVAMVLVVATMAGVMRWEGGGASTGSPANVTRIWHILGFDYEWRDLEVPLKLRVVGEQLV